MNNQMSQIHRSHPLVLKIRHRVSTNFNSATRIRFILSKFYCLVFISSQCAKFIADMILAVTPRSPPPHQTRSECMRAHTLLHVRRVILHPLTLLPSSRRTQSAESESSLSAAGRQRREINSLTRVERLFLKYLNS
jgi:hypothetical protein